MYLAHNYGFLAFAASMEGRAAETIEAARQTSKAVHPSMLDMMPGMDFFVAAPVLTLVRFGRWDDLLAEPRPPAKYLVLTGFWLHAHGMALAAKGRFDEAIADRDALAQLVATAPPDLVAGNNPARDVVAVAHKNLDARVATLQKKPDALSKWEEAVQLGDKLGYSEPDDWFYPVRHYQGAALVAAGKWAEAEAVYRRDLAAHPKNGWALYGLWQSLDGQHKSAEAAATKTEFERAWSRADIRLTASAF
jgi:tetratricopeptide (TPR) repeat protein